MTLILPLFNMLILVGVSILLYRLVKRTGKRQITIKRAYLILSSYIVLLVIGVVIFVASPYPQDALLNQGAEADHQLSMFEVSYQVVENGVSIDRFDEYKQAEWAFELTGEHLQIQSDTTRVYEYPIIIEEKDQADGLLEVSTYSGPTQVKQFDLTHLLSPTTVEFKKGDLLNVYQVFGEVNVASFQKEFIFAQFSKEVSSDDVFSSPPIRLGDNLLYIRIPKGVEVEKGEYLNIEYLNK